MNNFKIPLLAPVTFKIFVKKVLRTPIAETWSNYHDLRRQAISKIITCNKIIESEGLESENTKSSIYDLHSFLTQDNVKTNLSYCPNYIRFVKFTKDLIDDFVNKQNDVQL